MASSNQDPRRTLGRFAAYLQSHGFPPEKGGPPSSGCWRVLVSSGGVQVSRDRVH